MTSRSPQNQRQVLQTEGCAEGSMQAVTYPEQRQLPGKLRTQMVKPCVGRVSNVGGIWKENGNVFF